MEQRQLLDGEAYVLREDMAVLEITGEDAKKWLHSLTSQNILNLLPGESTEALLLSPNGHIEFQLKVIASEAGLLVITPRESAAALQGWLSKMVFRSRVAVSISESLVIGAFRDLGIDAQIGRAHV